MDTGGIGKLNYALAVVVLLVGWMGAGAIAGEATPAIELTPTKQQVPSLAAAAAYEPRNNTIEIELSEYAGYAGLIAANGGLEANEQSLFFKKHGFKVKLSLSEEESWSALNSGKMAASATTVDVLAVYGPQFEVVVPAQIGFSRGADGIVVRNEIKSVNALKGKVLVTSQFTEADFMVRYLAQEAGLGVRALAGLKEPVDPEKINLVYAEDAFVAGDLFLKDVQEGSNQLAGCVTWDPKTTEVAAASKGRARVLMTNRNLLIVADILVVNKGFAQRHPEMVAGLVDGLLEGNQMVQKDPESQLGTVGKAFGWDRDKTRSELGKVHLSNGPENLAFFSGAIDAAGSFGYIYESAVYAYGKEFIKEPAEGAGFLDLKHLKALDHAGGFQGQAISISPIGAAKPLDLEGPVLSKDIRFTFEPNSATLDLNDKSNLSRLEDIGRLMLASPGSIVLLVGHVDQPQIFLESRRKAAGEAGVRESVDEGVRLSNWRANTIKRLLLERYKVETERVEAKGRGAEQPIDPKGGSINRRVEVQWFTLE